MKVLILGDGPDELAWARAVLAHPDHTLVAAYPGFPELPPLPVTATDLDDALAIGELDSAIVGGTLEFRGEALRRAASVGLPVICLHPPGVNTDPYYQVALSEFETGAIVVPDLPIRHHPGFQTLARALASGELGTFRALQHEIVSAGDPDHDLLQEVFPAAVDPIRLLLGEIDSVGATGDPIEGPPTLSLVVQLRAGQARNAEVRIWQGPEDSAKLILTGSESSLTLEYDPGFLGASQLARKIRGTETRTELAPFDPYQALLQALSDAIGGNERYRPNLLDGTRAMEVSEACGRSLRRHRTIELHYEEVSESGNFKSVMTSVGCFLLFAILFVLPVALAGPALGMNWTIYLAWAMLPILVLFVLLQSLKLAIKSKGTSQSGSELKTASPRAETADVEP